MFQYLKASTQTVSRVRSSPPARSLHYDADFNALFSQSWLSISPSARFFHTGNAYHGFAQCLRLVSEVRWHFIQSAATWWAMSAQQLSKSLLSLRRVLVSLCAWKYENSLVTMEHQASENDAPTLRSDVANTACFIYLHIYSSFGGREGGSSW